MTMIHQYSLLVALTIRLTQIKILCLMLFPAVDGKSSFTRLHVIVNVHGPSCGEFHSFTRITRSSMTSECMYMYDFLFT